MVDIKQLHLFTSRTKKYSRTWSSTRSKYNMTKQKRKQINLSADFSNQPFRLLSSPTWFNKTFTIRRLPGAWKH